MLGGRTESFPPAWQCISFLFSCSLLLQIESITFLAAICIHSLGIPFHNSYLFTRSVGYHRHHASCHLPFLRPRACFTRRYSKLHLPRGHAGVEDSSPRREQRSNNRQEPLLCRLRHLRAADINCYLPCHRRCCQTSSRQASGTLPFLHSSKRRQPASQRPGMASLRSKQP